MKTKPRPSEKLIQRLRDELNLEIPTGATINRTYAGYWQRAEGSWVWFVTPKIGSQFTVTQLLKHKKLEVSESDGDISIFPYEEQT